MATTEDVVGWINTVCAAYRVGGFLAARDVLDELQREHKFDALGMELNSHLPGLDRAEVESVVYEMRWYARNASRARQEAKQQSFGMMYGSTGGRMTSLQPNIQQPPRRK